MRLFAISGSVFLVGIALIGAVQMQQPQQPSAPPPSEETPALKRAQSPDGAQQPEHTPIVDQRATFDDTPAYAKIHALTYNVFMRPPPVSWRDENSCRAQHIADLLSEPTKPIDIIALTESFESKSVQKLAKSTQERYPHQVLSQPPARGLSVNGGVSILSPHPIEDWSATAFEECFGKWNDCLASKGFVWARVRIAKDLKLNVLATHLNSGGAPGARAARRSQLTQIRDFIQTHPSIARWPTLLMGDLNINGLRWEARHPETGALSEYAESMELLGNTCMACEDEECFQGCNALPVDTFRAAHEPWAYNEAQTHAANTYNCLGEVLEPCQSPNAAEYWKRRLRIDYIMHFGAPRDAPMLSTRTLESKTLEIADDACNTNYLSDHRAIESTLEIGHYPLVKAQLDTEEPRSKPSDSSAPKSTPN